MHPLLLLVGGGAFLATLLLTQSGCNLPKKKEEDEPGLMMCEGSGYKPMGCKPVNPDRIASMRQFNLSAIDQLKRAYLQPLDEKIKEYEARDKAMKDKMEWCKTNPQKELEFLLGLRPKIESGQETEFGLHLILTDKDKTNALAILDAQIAHQRGRIEGTSYDERDLSCNDYNNYPGYRNALPGLIKERDGVKGRIAELEAEVNVEASEFDPEEIGPLKEVIPAGELPVFIYNRNCYDSCDDKYGTKVDPKIAHASPLAFSHERHLPYIQKDMASGSLGCALCHSDGMGTLQEHVKNRMVVNIGKDDKDKDINGILISDSRPLHEPTCVNCHSSHGYCSTCHDAIQSKRPRFPIPFTAPYEAQFGEYDIVEGEKKTSLKKR